MEVALYRYKAPSLSEVKRCLFSCLSVCLCLIAVPEGFPFLWGLRVAALVMNMVGGG